MNKKFTMSVNQDSLKARKSCSSRKLSLMGSSLHGEFGMREMVNNDIFYAFLISNLEIEFLKNQDPMN